MAQTYRELVVWQLAVELRDQTIALLETLPVGGDRDFFDQLRDAVSSPARNIAEGFGRYKPRDFARFLVIAIASLDETDSHLRDLATRRRQVARSCGMLIRLSARCRVGVERLRIYLLSSRNPYFEPSTSPRDRPRKAR